MALNARVSNIIEEPANRNLVHDTEADTKPTVDNQRLNIVKLILFFIHIIVTIVFFIPMIFIIWNDT
jgi:hypothetical protein